MITVAGRPYDLSSASGRPGADRAILTALSDAGASFAIADDLDFETRFRGATVDAARALDHSGMGFSIFRRSRCNRRYWDRRGDGGFELASGANPSAAIEDIFRNGEAYATECATAIVIVYYKAALDTLGTSVFDRVFQNMVLMDWQHINPELKEIGIMQDVGSFVPGDRLYFNNPDVNPDTPEWQGENVILLGPDSYYGHGLGIRSAASMINALNHNRVEGARRTAYLMQEASRPDYRRLASLAGMRPVSAHISGTYAATGMAALTHIPGVTFSGTASGPVSPGHASPASAGGFEDISFV